jgi:hypothetical protein
MKPVLSLLRLLGMSLVIVCICRAVWIPTRKASIAFTAGANGETAITLNQADTGRYSLYLVYALNSLPPYIGRVGFLSEEHSNVLWRATLSIESEQGQLLTTDTLRLKPTSLIGTQQYFLIGSWNLDAPERLDIKLVSNEPCPLGPVTQLAIRPSELYYKAYAANRSVWTVLYAVATLAMLAIVTDVTVRLAKAYKERK